MIIYNVTVNVEESINTSWLNYMKSEHIPDVMNTGCFVDFTFSKILTKQDDETGQTYSVQYKCASMKEYDNYIEHHANRMREEVLQKFPGKFYAFRTLLEVIE